MVRAWLRFLAVWVGAVAAATAQAPAASPAADIEAGAALFRTHCATCHGPEGSAIQGNDLRRGEFRRGSTPEDLFKTITNGVPGTPMTGTYFSLAQLWQLVAFLRSLRESPAAADAGDPRRGRAVFEGKGECRTCHRVTGNGARLGPDLSEVGARRAPAYLKASILRPGETVMPDHWFLRAVTRDGRTISGRRLNEDTHSIQLLDSQERLGSLLKADLKEYRIVKESPMPSYQGKLTPQELEDLVAYLATLKGAL